MKTQPGMTAMQNTVETHSPSQANNDALTMNNEEYPLSQEDLKDLGITPRQYEVLQLLSKGLTYKEIGKELFVSENTVKFHCKALYKKFGINSRNELLYKLMMFVYNKHYSDSSSTAITLSPSPTSSSSR